MGLASRCAPTLRVIGRMAAFCCAVHLSLHCRVSPASETRTRPIDVTLTPAPPGETVTFRLRLTGKRVVVSGGRFGAGSVVTGQTKLTDHIQRTTRYAFDVWYAAKQKSGSSAPEIAHAHYTVDVRVLSSSRQADAAPPASRQAAPAAPSADEDQIVGEVFTLTNAERVKNGIAPLKRNAALEAAADSQARDMARYEYVGHTDHQGRSMDRRIPGFGYSDFTTIGENAAGGQRTAQDVVVTWMHSPGHRANILNPAFTEIGIGHCINASGKYVHDWVQDFGARSDNSTDVNSTTDRRSP